VKFQFNKTALQSLNKQLDVRLKALPVIKNKETALRVEVKRAKIKLNEIDEKLSQRMHTYLIKPEIWNEFNANLISVADVKISTKKIAGVKTPVLEDVIIDVENFSLFNDSKWFAQGISIVKDVGKIIIERELCYRKMELLSYARRKTTQKVNLYEKVQIPSYKDAIRKIKRFLEDEENLSKSSQKIVKNRQQKQEVER